MAMKLLQVWHPEKPGVTIWVARSLFGRLFYPKDYATLSEVSRWQHLGEAVNYLEKRRGVRLIFSEAWLQGPCG